MDECSHAEFFQETRDSKIDFENQKEDVFTSRIIRVADKLLYEFPNVSSINMMFDFALLK